MAAALASLLLAATAAAAPAAQPAPPPASRSAPPKPVPAAAIAQFRYVYFTPFPFGCTCGLPPLLHQGPVLPRARVRPRGEEHRGRGRGRLAPEDAREHGGRRAQGRDGVEIKGDRPLAEGPQRDPDRGPHGRPRALVRRADGTLREQHLLWPGAARLGHPLRRGAQGRRL